MHDISNPIKKFRKEKLEIEDIPILEPLKLNPEKSQEGKDFARDLSLLDADFIVVISY
jgi:methionyl-tRNA formyltransferase